MGFEEGAERPRAAAFRAEIADPRQLLAQGLAVGVLAGQRIVALEQAGEDAGGHHGRGEARALLVGPDRHLQRSLCCDVVVVQGPDHLEAGQHAVDAVELAAKGLGVEMAAGDHRRQIVAPAGAAGEDVAHVVDGDGAARGLAPGDEEVAPGLVLVAERQAAAAAGRSRTDLGHRHEAAP
jgi:hypothetical protein